MLKFSAQQQHNQLKSMIYLTILDNWSRLAVLAYLVELAKLEVLANLGQLAFLACLV